MSWAPRAFLPFRNKHRKTSVSPVRSCALQSRLFNSETGFCSPIRVARPGRAMEASGEPEQGFAELRDSVSALLTACIEFGSELVQAVPPNDEERGSEDSRGEASANLKLVDEALTAYFSSAFDLKRRNSQTQFSVAIIALAKSGVRRENIPRTAALRSHGPCMCAVLVMVHSDEQVRNVGHPKDAVGIQQACLLRGTAVNASVHGVCLCVCASAPSTPQGRGCHNAQLLSNFFVLLYRQVHVHQRSMRSAHAASIECAGDRAHLPHQPCCSRTAA